MGDKLIADDLYLIQQALQQGQAATLSPHPTTQARLREMQRGESR